MSNIPDHNTALIDGQSVFIPSQRQLEKLINTDNIDEIIFITPSVGKILSNLADNISIYPEIFSLGLYQPSEFLETWLPLVLLKSTDGWRRAHLETVSCNKCSWRGLIANPTDPSLFHGVKDYWRAMDRGASIATATCPRCHEKLPRLAAWAEPTAK